MIPNITDIMFCEDKKEYLKDRSNIRLWKELWDAAYTVNPTYARELCLQFQLDDDLMSNPDKIDDNRRVQLISILTTFLKIRDGEKTNGITIS